MKDNFSTQANLYASFRPHYPQAMYDILFEQVKGFDTALDCATGNGQVAAVLAAKFREVYATDISEKQLAEAPVLPNVRYSVQPAEQTTFADASFNLITVAQAIHWFNFDAFYADAKRLLKPGGMLAVIGYGRVRVNEKVDVWLDNFYWNIVGPYWDKERHYIDEAYQTIPFPFAELPMPKLSINYSWDKQHLIGYLNTWSALQHYVKANNSNPLTPQLLAALDMVWPDGAVMDVRFPLFLRVGNDV